MGEPTGGRNLMRLDVVRSDRPVRAPAGLLLVALTVLLLTVLTGAARALDDGAKAPDGLLGLPDRLDAPGYLTPTAVRSPRGPVALLEVGSRGPYLGFDDSIAAGLVGPGGYRMSARVGYDQFHAGEDMLLAPQGDRLVFPALHWSAPAFPMEIQDLRTGRKHDVRLPVTDTAGSAVTAGEWYVLAWTPDGTSLVVGRYSGYDATGAPAVNGSGEVGVLTLRGQSSGAYRRVAASQGSLVPGFAVAVSPDGSLLAFQQGRDLLVYGVADAAMRTSTTLRAGALLAGKGAWTPDGSAVAIAVPSPVAADRPAEWRIQLLDAVTGAVRTAQPFPPVTDAIAVRAQGWSPDGALLAVAYRPEREGQWPLPSLLTDADRTRFENVRRADLVSLRPGDDQPRTLLRPPSQTLSLDVAQAAISSGHRFANPKPPPVHLSPVKAFGVMVVGSLLLLLVVIRVLGFTVRRPRRPVPRAPTLAELAVQGW